MKKAIQKIRESSLYSENILQELTSFQRCVTSDYPGVNLKVFIHDLPKSKNMEKFYANFYSQVLKHSKTYFPGLSEASSKILVMKLCDFLANFEEHSKLENARNIIARSISSRELGGLQYLAGYVMFNVYKKLKLFGKKECLEFF